MSLNILLLVLFNQDLQFCYYKRQININRRTMQAKTHSMFLLIFFITLSWQQPSDKLLQSIELTLPGHTFKIQPGLSPFINSTISWNGNSGMRAYLYLEGSNLQGNSYVANFTSECYNNVCEIAISYEVPNNHSSYFMRLEAEYFKAPYLKVNIQVAYQKNDEISRITYEDYFVSNQKYRNQSAFLINKQQYQSYYTISSSNHSAGSIIFMVTPQTYRLIPEGERSCAINYTGWVVILTNVVTETTILQKFIFHLYENTSDLCNATSIASETQLGSAIAISTIFTITIGVLIGFVILLVVPFLIIHKCKNRNKKGSQNVRIVNTPVPEQSKNMNYDSATICPICLSDKCDSFLTCQHYFHKNCILRWLKVNAQCPICRKRFENTQIFMIN